MVMALAIVSALLVISEALPFSDKIKGNGIYQEFLNILKFLKAYLSKKD